MADKRNTNVDPNWPETKEDVPAVSELNADRQGALSPFGEVEFPVDPSKLPYRHPTTIINR